MMNLQRKVRRVGALVAVLALYATPALAQDGGDDFAAPPPRPAPVEEVEQPPAPAPDPEQEQPVEQPVGEQPGELDEGTKKVLEGIERLAGDLGLVRVGLADNAKQLGALREQVAAVNHSVDVNREALGAALGSLARLEDTGGRNCSGNGVCFLGRCFCAARLEETTDRTLTGVEAANAKLDMVIGGDGNGPGLSDIVAAADAASRGGDTTCANNCTGRHGVCAFGQCFASAEGIDETIGTVNASVAEVNEALSQQSQLAEINAGTLSGIREEVAGLQGQISALRIGL